MWIESVSRVVFSLCRRHRIDRIIAFHLAIYAFALVYPTRVFAINVPEFSDDFNRSNSTNLGSGWYESSGDYQISSNQLETTVLPSLATQTSPATQNNNYVQFQYISGTSVGALTQCDTLTCANGYLILYRQSNSDVLIYEIVSGSYQLLGSAVGGHTFTQNDLLRSEIIIEAGEATISVFSNDSLLGSLVDASATTGDFVGVRNAPGFIDNYESGYIQTATPTPLPPTPTPTPNPLTPTPTPTPDISPTATPSASLGLQDEIGFQFLAQIISFTLGLVGYTVLASNLYKR